MPSSWSNSKKSQLGSELAICRSLAILVTILMSHAAIPIVEATKLSLIYNHPRRDLDIT